MSGAKIRLLTSSEAVSTSYETRSPTHRLWRGWVVHKYTLLADVPETDDDGNFFVDVEEFKDTENREVIVW